MSAPKKRFKVTVGQLPYESSVIDTETGADLSVESIAIHQDMNGGYLQLRIPLLFVEIVPAEPKPSSWGGERP